jgi:hypothetical protein
MSHPRKAHTHGQKTSAYYYEKISVYFEGTLLVVDLQLVLLVTQQILPLSQLARSPRRNKHVVTAV